MSADLFGGLPVAFTFRAMLDELDRELRLRRRVYPRWIAGGKMSQAQGDKAISTLEAVRDLVASLEAPAEPMLERMARAHDEADAAHMGEPSPWRDSALDDMAWRSERLASIGEAVKAILPTAGTT